MPDTVYVAYRPEDALVLGAWSTIYKAERFRDTCGGGGKDIIIHELFVDEGEGEEDD